MPPTDLDDEWIQMVVKAGKMEESCLAEERLLRGPTDKPQEGKSNPAKGKKRTRETSSRRGGANHQGLPQRFEKPKDFNNLTSAKKVERSKRLRGIPLETLKKRRDEKAC
jgi:hypothetical protein